MKLHSLVIAAALAAAPIASFAQDWTGPYAGFQIGGSDIDVDGAAELTGDGPSYGIFAGYNVQNGAIVYGGEIDYDVTEYEIAGGAQEVDSTTRLKGRIGTELGGGLAYGTAGVVWATSPGLGDDNGYLVGVGYDLPVTQNMTVGAEILQHEFEDYNDTDLDVGVTTFKARVSFSF
ncbi:outer membrane protein [Roseobacter sp. CCS2]|uniref:outer membrane protein n=1 Tax=Roseobacter sp. CCS2 TaxID=391593 RepID=UPI0000F402AA|nr:outer membrane beta-barrel protein [Roseobacter sp. CCS2]EBA14217.1 outer membrane protein, putative [Roseobacter sp. CCS2]